MFGFCCRFLRIVGGIEHALILQSFPKKRSDRNSLLRMCKINCRAAHSWNNRLHSGGCVQNSAECKSARQNFAHGHRRVENCALYIKQPSLACAHVHHSAKNWSSRKQEEFEPTLNNLSRNSQYSEMADKPTTAGPCKCSKSVPTPTVPV